MTIPSTIAICLAATLSAGNDAFEATARRGALEIALAREHQRLIEKGPATGSIADAMLADPTAYVSVGTARTNAWEKYRENMSLEYARTEAEARSRLGIAADSGNGGFSFTNDAQLAAARATFAKRYAAERSEACERQAKELIRQVRPNEVEFETLGEDAYAKAMSDRVAARQSTPVFEENRAYISRNIVAPVIAAAKAERTRQGTYLREVRSDAAAPTSLARDLTAKLAANVAMRQAKAKDLSESWAIFPSVTNDVLDRAVTGRLAKRLANRIAETPFEVTVEGVAGTIAADRANHRKAKSSEELFRRNWSVTILRQAEDELIAAAPAEERKELMESLHVPATSDAVTKALSRRIDGTLLDSWRNARSEVADGEFVSTWPSLKRRTWFPDAQTADDVAASSNFGDTVRAWREIAAIADLSRPSDALEETDQKADRSVRNAFELARSAINAQKHIVEEIHPQVQGDAQARKDSFWRSTPDVAEVVKMLTAAVEERWADTKVKTLWPKDDAPENAAEQHSELFPSVRKLIESIARTIVAEINKPDPEEEPEEPELTYSITASREGDSVTVRLDRNGETIFRRESKARMGDFRGAMNAVGEKLGKDILKLK